MDGNMKFFTNEPERNLYERFNKILKNNTQFFDVLVGYFRASGFYLLQDAIEQVEHTRILIGINTDEEVLKMYKESKDGITEITLGTYESKEKYKDTIKQELSICDDSVEIEKGINKFVELLKNHKLELRMYTKHTLHAKVYIMLQNQEALNEYGRVITGSSNFSYSGLKNNLEFNVELKDKSDVEFAENKFEELWKEAIDVSEECVETIEKDTWLKKDITPYEMYLKFLYEYFKEELNDDKILNFDETKTPVGFKLYHYQWDAVVQAYKRLKKHNGVFISDVVGLGKTYVCAMLAGQLSGKKLFLVPPTLIDYWESVLRDFFVSGYAVKSSGNLAKICDENSYTEYDYVFIDEAHKYRNDETAGYAELSEICMGRKVVLITATPQNNYVNDIASQIYLFESKNNSTIPGLKNLGRFFDNLRLEVKSHKDDADEYKKSIREASENIRDNVLREVMIRRTRKEIQENYKEDIKEQGLKFPTVNAPNKEVYEFDDATEEVFEKTLEAIKNISYARYQSLVYVYDKFLTPDQQSLKTGFKNMRGFMKGILVKRLESSKYAFIKTLSRFIESHEKFIKMYDSGEVRISKKIKNIDLYNEEEINSILNSDLKTDVMAFNSTNFKPEFIELIKKDLHILNELYKAWDTIKNDCKLDSFLELLRKDKKLHNKIIIFTESTETAKYLSDNIEKELERSVIRFDGSLSSSIRERIRRNFDANIPKESREDEYDILVTTDVLAEGMNLHRSNIIINYDLPWNPTKIMQRVGRINRVGTEFDNLYIYNYFPTASSDDINHQSENIISKIQMFHDILGEDSKFLTEEEEISTHELFDKMNSDFTEEEAFNNELKYLRKIKEIRDNDRNLFNTIKNYPPKIRIGRKGKKNELITFFRKGDNKKIYLTNGESTKEIEFIEAIKYIEADEKEKTVQLSNKYYDYLNKNKNQFALSENQNEDEFIEVKRRGKDNAKEIENVLLYLVKSNLLEDKDAKRCSKIIVLLREGILPKKILKKLVKEYVRCEKTNDGLIDFYLKVNQTIKPVFFDKNEKEGSKANEQKEIILSEMFIK